MLCFLLMGKFSRQGNSADGDIEEEKREVNLMASDGASKLGQLTHACSPLHDIALLAASVFQQPSGFSPS
ncbi:hypothetical protein Plim_3430 [Planctopirus limnophila DSM 3776]|uniref:Uncharacterized protein n=1 Tax=Planctopirus limnophila (strain ATCC 43296 / DSM 3776 / IFAM 1008 / Mu 290) TaxID=521674 RepID=D5SUV7_PLAL2|nr:hypothetical protein Plim_3430 [Planctopirus limnophila DSM 3776]